MYAKPVTPEDLNTMRAKMDGVIMDFIISEIARIICLNDLKDDHH